MKKLILFLFLVAQSLAVPLPQDPNDDAEVFSGPINSNAGDNDYDYFGSFVPRVRVFLIPSRSTADDYFYDYPDVVRERPSFDSLFNIVKSFLGSRPSSITPSNKTVSDEKCFLCSIFKDSFDNVQDRVATKIFEGFGEPLFKEFNIGWEPVSTVHYMLAGSSIKRPTLN